MAAASLQACKGEDFLRPAREDGVPWSTSRWWKLEGFLPDVPAPHLCTARRGKGPVVSWEGQDEGRCPEFMLPTGAQASPHPASVARVSSCHPRLRSGSGLPPGACVCSPHGQGQAAAGDPGPRGEDSQGVGRAFLFVPVGRPICGLEKTRSLFK